MQEFKLKIMERKVLVDRISALTGIQSQFMRGRDHSYKIGDYTVTRDCIFIAPDDADEELLQTLFNEELIEKPTQEIEPVPQEIDEGNCEENADSEESVSECVIEPVLALPLIDHTGLSLRNLVHLFYTRASLIEKSIGAHCYVSDAVIDALKDDACTYSVGNFLRTVSAFSSDLQGLYFTDDSIFITAFKTQEQLDIAVKKFRKERSYA